MWFTHVIHSVVLLGRIRGQGITDYGLEILARTMSENLKLKSRLRTLE